MLDDTGPKWPFDQIGPRLGEKFKIARNAAQVGSEFTANGKYYFRDAVIAQAIGMSPTAWSNAKRGLKRKDGKREFVHGRHLVKLATYFHLDDPRYLGPQAWEWLTPTQSSQDFENALRRVGYGCFSTAGAQSTHAGGALLAWFSDHCTISSLGIEVLRSSEIDPEQLSATRALGVIDQTTEAQESAMVQFTAGDDIVVRITADGAAYVVLLQLVELKHAPYFALHCLAPSYRHSAIALATNCIIPAGIDAKGRRGFMLGQDPGQIDLLALISTQSIALPFDTSSNSAHASYHRIASDEEIQQLKALIAERNADPTSDIRVLHAPIRINQ